jgi:hypothetical protein
MDIFNNILHLDILYEKKELKRLYGTFICLEIDYNKFVPERKDIPEGYYAYMKIDNIMVTNITIIFNCSLNIFVYEQNFIYDFEYIWCFTKNEYYMINNIMPNIKKESFILCTFNNKTCKINGNTINRLLFKEKFPKFITYL